MNPNVADFDHEPMHWLITGAGGTGKTTLYLREVCAHPARYKFIFDYGGQFAHRVGCRSARTIPEITQSLTDHGYAAFEPSIMFPRDTGRGFRMFCDLAFEIGTNLKGHKLFACDEFQEYTDTHTLPPEFSAVLETLRHYQGDFLTVSRSPNLTNTRVRNQVTRCTAFLATDENALKFLRGIGFDVARVAALRRFHYLTWHRDADPAQRFTEGKTTKL